MDLDLPKILAIVLKSRLQYPILYFFQITMSRNGIEVQTLLSNCNTKVSEKKTIYQGSRLISVIVRNSPNFGFNNFLINQIKYKNQR